MSRIPINEVYFVSKHGKNSNQRGTRLQAWQELQSTRCTSSPSMSRIPINEVYFVSMSGEERERNDVVRRVSGVDGKECEEIGV